MYKLVKVFETCFSNCVQAVLKAPKADLMSSHLSNHDAVPQTFPADYGTSKNIPTVLRQLVLP